MQVVQFVHISEVELLPVGFGLIKVNQVGDARHVLTRTVITLKVKTMRANADVISESVGRIVQYSSYRP